MVVESGKPEKGSSKIIAHRGAENAAAQASHFRQNLILARKGNHEWPLSQQRVAC
jgi:hypothetical protein